VALATNLTKHLFDAIEEQYATDADLLQLVPGGMHRDFVPNDWRASFPVVMVSQDESAGASHAAALSTGRIVGEDFNITFNVNGVTQDEVSQVAWQLALNTFDDWSGTYTGIEILSCERQSPPWVGQTEEGISAASVSFMVSAARNVEE
jgi:hypothetical protein